MTEPRFQQGQQGFAEVGQRLIPGL